MWENGQCLCEECWEEIPEGENPIVIFVTNIDGARVMRLICRSCLEEYEEGVSCK